MSSSINGSGRCSPVSNLEFYTDSDSDWEEGGLEDPLVFKPLNARSLQDRVVHLRSSGSDIEDLSDRSESEEELADELFCSECAAAGGADSAETVGVEEEDEESGFGKWAIAISLFVIAAISVFCLPAGLALLGLLGLHCIVYERSLWYQNQFDALVNKVDNKVCELFFPCLAKELA